MRNCYTCLYAKRDLNNEYMDMCLGIEQLNKDEWNMIIEALWRDNAMRNGIPMDLIFKVKKNSREYRIKQLLCSKI